MVRRLYSPSIEASKERIVSSGRSHRERVGLERSGSAACLLAVFQVTQGQICVPMGLPLTSLCWKERSDCRVGFSRAAATIQMISTGVIATTTTTGRTGLGLVHGGVGVCLCRGVVVRLALVRGALFALVFGLWALGGGGGSGVVAVVAAEAEARLCAWATRGRGRRDGMVARVAGVLRGVHCVVPVFRR